MLTTLTPPKTCSRCDLPRCGKPASRRCAKHHRFVHMRADAKYAGKSVPTEAALEELVLASDGLKCRDCNRQMNWFQSDGVGSVVTLQHYRDGTFGLVCRSCNAAHANWPGDVFVSVDRTTHKFCPNCGETKTLESFRKHGGSLCGRYSYCRDCDAVRRRVHTSEHATTKGELA